MSYARWEAGKKEVVLMRRILVVPTAMMLVMAGDDGSLDPGQE